MNFVEFLFFEKFTSEKLGNQERNYIVVFCIVKLVSWVKFYKSEVIIANEFYYITILIT